tara:strand:- start:55 stop:1440 length:1386 start_codon:yes stop_codon:yes gene_type:complete
MLVVPSDRSQSMTLSLKKKIKEMERKKKSSKALITEVELGVLRMPRQSISVLEPIIRSYFVKLYDEKYKHQNIGLTLSGAMWDNLVEQGLNDFLHKSNDGAKAKLIKRERLRFFAKAIASGRVKNLHECRIISDECTHVSWLNQTRGMIGFILDDLTLFNMMLSYSSDALEKYTSSFAAELLNLMAQSLVVFIGILQIASILKENQPLKLKHYAQISFVLIMTSLGLIGYCTGYSYFSILASSLSICRNILIFSNEYNEYQKAETGSDKQMAHKQACMSTLNDIVLSSLAVSLTVIVLLTPFPGATLTAFIIILTLAKIVWQLIPSQHKMSAKKALGFGKAEYSEILDSDKCKLPSLKDLPQAEMLAIAMPLDMRQSSKSQVIEVVAKPLDDGGSVKAQHTLSKSAKRRARRNKRALLSSSVVAEPINKSEKEIEFDKIKEKEEALDDFNEVTTKDPDPSP